MLIDAHHHVWDLHVRDQPWTRDLPVLRRSFAFDELALELRANAIDATVVVQTITDPAETPELLQLAKDTAAIAGVVGWVDLTADVATQIAALRAGPGGRWLVGVRHPVYVEPDPAWLCRVDVRRGLRELAAAGLAFDLLLTPTEVPAAIETVRELPELTFILDHAGKPLGGTVTGPWGSRISRLAALPNIAVKLSGLVTDPHPAAAAGVLAPFADHLLQTFGPQRIMFGSDWPVCLLQASYGSVFSTANLLVESCSEAEKAEVFGQSARRWYGLILGDRHDGPDNSQTQQVKTGS